MQPGPGTLPPDCTHLFATESVHAAPVKKIDVEFDP